MSITAIEGSTKTCSVCSVERDIDEFHVNNAHEDGRQSHCKLCIRAYKRGYLAGIRKAA